MKKRTLLLTLSTLTLSPNLQADVAKLLNWRQCHTPKSSCTLCNGYYAEPDNIVRHPLPPGYKKTLVTVTAKGPTIFRQNGDSILQKHVIVSQPGREIRADKAIIQHNPKTGKVTDIRLVGHVRAIEHGKLIVGKTANYDVAHDIFTMHDGAYHIAGQQELITVKTPYDAWGTAKKIIHKNNVTTLKDGTYSTCPPKSPTWMLSATTMELDKNENEGRAKNIVLRVMHIPIFYAPYFSFPLNRARKSGFLAPRFGYATDHGAYVNTPIYWNMAPNYDLLLSPTWYQKRSEKLDTTFRLMTQNSYSEIFASFIPNDKEFAQFKDETLASFAGKTLSDTTAPYIDELRSASTDRAFFDFSNHINFSRRLKSDIVLKYATDPYFTRDFSSDYFNHNTNQLSNYASVNYEGDHWNDTLLLQAYQTLHTLDNITTPAQNQYRRLPEFDFNATYPAAFDDFNFDLNGQLVHFDYHSAFYPFTYQRPTGNRIHLQPMISRPFTWQGGYVTPAVTIDSTSYFSKLAATSGTAPRSQFDASHALPIFDIDGGMYFHRNFSLAHKHYTQTFEPRLFYLYTPYENQDRYPNFDTQLLPFSFSDLFTLNRFTGYDRLQNANQLSVGFTSHILSDEDTSNILTANLGFISYFTNPRVCLLPTCKNQNTSISPISGTLTFNPYKHWSLGGSMAWDTALHQVNNAQINMKYHFDHKHLAILGYSFTHGNPDTPFDSLGFSTNSSLLTAGVMWPITHRFNVFGYTNYNLTRKHPEDEYMGFSYNTCCWSFRAIIRNDYDGTVQVDGGRTYQNKYNTNYYFEVLLKGLGSAGNRGATGMLTSTLPGFEDAFSKHSYYGFSHNI